MNMGRDGTGWSSMIWVYLGWLDFSNSLLMAHAVLFLLLPFWTYAREPYLYIYHWRRRSLSMREMGKGKEREWMGGAGEVIIIAAAAMIVHFMI